MRLSGASSPLYPRLRYTECRQGVITFGDSLNSAHSNPHFSQTKYQQLVAKIRDEKRKRELAFMLSIPVFSQLARLVSRGCMQRFDDMLVVGIL